MTPHKRCVKSPPERLIVHNGDMSFQVGLLVESLGAVEAGVRAQVGVDGPDMTLQVGFPRHALESFVAEVAPSLSF